MRKLVVYGLLLSLTACAGSPPPAPNPALDVFRETGTPLTEDLKERRIAVMTSMIRATGLEPFDVMLVKDGHALSAKLTGAGECTVELSYSYRPAYGVSPESATFSFDVYNASGVHLVQKHPLTSDSASRGFDPDHHRDLKYWTPVRHCSEPVK